MCEQVRQLAANGALAAPEMRDYGIGAQILADLGVRDMVRLSNNPRPIVGLEGYGLRVLETRPDPEGTWNEHRSIAGARGRQARRAARRSCW